MIGHPPFFRLAARVVHNVRRRFAHQIDLIEEKLYRRLQAETGQVVGVLWRGRGADAFAQELNGEILPAVQQVLASINQMDEKLAAAAGIMAQADEQVEATATALADSFRQIYES
jgi:WXG100 family type VII secretion target